MDFLWFDTEIMQCSAQLISRIDAPWDPPRAAG